MRFGWIYGIKLWQSWTSNKILLSYVSKYSILLQVIPFYCLLVLIYKNENLWHYSLMLWLYGKYFKCTITSTENWEDVPFFCHSFLMHRIASDLIGRVFVIVFWSNQFSRSSFKTIFDHLQWKLQRSSHWLIFQDQFKSKIALAWIKLGPAMTLVPFGHRKMFHRKEKVK